MNWFEVDKDGLAKIIEKRGKYRAVVEPIQNAWDQKSTRVEISLEPLPNKPIVRLSVTDDDPEGFADLSHAFTLFAESNKKGNPEQRGRFNIGEKLILALCNSAVIRSTTGTIVFGPNGRQKTRTRTQAGSTFTGEIRMTREELYETMAWLKTLIPPPHIITTINDEVLDVRQPIKVFEATLPTEIADNEGFLHRTRRKTAIEIFEPRPGEESSIYEMGIPVVTTGDKYHINVLQKVPLNTDRDNVTPAFLQELRTLVFNNMHNQIDTEDANTTWVRAATSDDRCDPDAMATAINKRFGEKRVIYDPSDPEANNKAFAQGYTVIHGSQLNKKEWANVRNASLAQPAGQVTPAKPQFDKSIPPVPQNKWTEGMKRIHDYAIALAKKLMGIDLHVAFLDTDHSSLLAYYNKGKPSRLVFYVRQLGHDWFDLTDNTEKIDELIIHEFGHEYSSNHLSNEYHEALSSLGAKLKALALKNAEFFHRSACVDQLT